MCVRVPQRVRDELLHTTKQSIGARRIECRQVLRDQKVDLQTRQAFGQGQQCRPQIDRLNPNLADDAAHFIEQRSRDRARTPNVLDTGSLC